MESAVRLDVPEPVQPLDAKVGPLLVHPSRRRLRSESLPLPIQLAPKTLGAVQALAHGERDFRGRLVSRIHDQHRPDDADDDVDRKDGHHDQVRGVGEDAKSPVPRISNPLSGWIRHGEAQRPVPWAEAACTASDGLRTAAGLPPLCTVAASAPPAVPF